jgi:hypothetical protein
MSLGRSLRSSARSDQKSPEPLEVETNPASSAPPQFGQTPSAMKPTPGAPESYHAIFFALENR